jgi:3,4-dihydroxy 2-butanone 4-phosphate synthase/GTP cyclohydrolase II
MARVPELMVFAELHGLHVVTIADLIAYRRRWTRVVERHTEALLPLEAGEFRIVGYRELLKERDHIALVFGEVGPHEPALVRVHSECVTGDVFGSRRCDCGRQLELSLETIAEHGAGVLVYLRGHEGRGIALLEQLSAYHLEDRDRLDTVAANLRLGHPRDARDYAVAVQILADLGIRRLRLLTNDPAEQAALEGYGVEVVERLPPLATPTPHNVAYLATKQRRVGHPLRRDGSFGAGASPGSFVSPKGPR